MSSRHAIGQWFTPKPVAELALRLALAEAERPQGRLLDPSCGDGVFLERARALGLHQIAGIDVDAKAVQSARERVPEATITHGSLFDHKPQERFSLVVGNPPWVRQERLGSAEKERIAASLRAAWPHADSKELRSLVGRGDLAIACMARALAWTELGGALSFVVSKALLDSDYASALWGFVSARAEIVALVDAPGEKWFEDAAVNAVIVVMRRRDAAAPPTPTLARLTVPTHTAAQAVRSVDDLKSVSQVRVGAGHKTWRTGLRASEAWFRFKGAMEPHLAPLGELAQIRRGLTSGANDFFYMSRSEARDRGLWSFTKPLMKSSQAVGPAIALDPTELPHRVLVAPSDLRLSENGDLRRYVEAHEHLSERPSLRGRLPWWSLSPAPAELFFSKAYDRRFLQHTTTAPVVADQRVYALRAYHRLLPAVLNSTLSAFAIESLGRASMGDGALEWTVADALELPTVDPSRVEEVACAEMMEAFESVSQRPIGSIDHEVGQADRQALDRALLGAHAELLPEIYDAVVESVGRRVERATAPSVRA